LRATCRRRDAGQAIRDAMKAQKVSLPRLAELTKELDSDDQRGVSFQLIGFLVATGRSARETTSPRTAALIARALECREDALFDHGPMPAPCVSTE
jgi:hypothetical protein